MTKLVDRDASTFQMMRTTPTLAAVAAMPLHQAGFVSRAAAFVLDVLLVTAGSIIFAALVSLLLSFFGFDTQTLSIDNPATSILGVIQIIIIAISTISVFLFVPGYFILSWVLVGATPGKQVLGLRVIRTNKTPLGWGRAIVRFVGYYISAIAFFLGYFWVFVDGRRQAWHDKMADTFVVYSWDIAKFETDRADTASGQAGTKN